MTIEIGDKVITVKTLQDEQPGEIKSRHFGIVQSIKGGWVTIVLADGSAIRRKSHNVAVFIVEPPNWEELFHRQEVPPPPPVRR